MKRSRWSLAALVTLALIVAGCSEAAAGPGTASNNAAATAPAGSGSSGNNSTPARVGSGGGTTAYEQAVKFAACMRANGVSKFPDPDASGNLTMDQVANGSSLDTNTAAFKQAISACRDLEPPGFTGGTRSPEQQQAALKFAQCVRDNGVRDFPDPAPDGPLIDTNRIPSAAGRGARSIPGLTAALQKCRDFAAAAGVAGGQ